MPIICEKAARFYQSGSASHSEDLRLVLFVKNRLATSKRSITLTLGVSRGVKRSVSGVPRHAAGSDGWYAPRP
jgi:hypothetical protein